MTFYSNINNGTYTLNSTLTVTGTLTFDGSSTSAGMDIASGTIDAQGAVVTDDADHGGTGLIRISGSANRTWTGTPGTTGTVPNVEINTSGTLTLSGTIRTDEDWTYTAGTVDSSGATVVFWGAGTTPTITGAHSLTNVTFYSDSSSGRSYTIASSVPTTTIIAGFSNKPRKFLEPTGTRNICTLCF